MALKIFSGTANPGLAEAIARDLGQAPGKLNLQRFPDGELSIEVEENVRGQDIYLVQPTSPPVADNLLELLLITDALYRAGAEKITAVIPYFGYARQDRRVTGSEPISARLIASLLGATAVSRIIAVDIHNPSLEGFFNIPFENISAVSLLAGAAGKAGADVVVSPDLGAAKLAERYAALLGLPVAIVRKERISGSEVKVHALTGDVCGKKPLLVDDMISTAGTVEAAAKALQEAGCLPEVSVAATHGLLVGPAKKRLMGLPLKRLYLTNSIARDPDIDLPVEEVSLGLLLADVIQRLHNYEPIIDLLVHL